MRHPDAMPASATNNPLPDGLVRLRLHVNLAVQYGILLAVVLGFLRMLTTGASDWDTRIAEWQRGATGGLVAGIFVSLIYGWIQWRAAVATRDRRLAADPTASPTVDPSVRARQTVLAPRSRAEILAGEAEAASVLGERAHVRKVDEAAGTIALSTSASGWSRGEAVKLTVGTEQGGSTPVTVSSRPRVWGMPTDGGANARNVESLATWLRDRAA
jgi:hypothetical protein